MIATPNLKSEQKIKKASTKLENGENNSKILGKFSNAIIKNEDSALTIS